MSEWVQYKLVQCADILDHMRIPVNGEERSKNPGNTPYYGANGIQGFINGWIFDERLILIAEDGGYFDEHSTRPVAYKITGKSWVNNHAHILRPKEHFNFDFLFYSLEHKNIMPFIKGGTRAKLNQKELREIKIHAPKNKLRQKKIASILQSIDQTIEKTEALIEKYQQMKAGLMHDLFTRGITADGKLRPTREQAPELYQETAIGWIPVEWKVKVLNDVTNKITDGTHQAVTTNTHGDIPFLFVSCVREDEILWNQAAYVSSRDYLEISKGRQPKNGIILYTAVDSYGYASLVRNDKPFSFQRHIAFISPDREKIDPEFLINWLNSSTSREYADSVAVGNAQKTVTLGALSKFPVPIPCDVEQQLIAMRLNAVKGKLDHLKIDTSKFQKIKSGLMHDLLTGKVPVTVDENEIIHAN